MREGVGKGGRGRGGGRKTQRTNSYSSIENSVPLASAILLVVPNATLNREAV